MKFEELEVNDKAVRGEKPRGIELQSCVVDAPALTVQYNPAPTDRIA